MDPSLVKGQLADVGGIYHGSTSPTGSPVASPAGRRSKAGCPKSACPAPSFLGPVNCCAAPAAELPAAGGKSPIGGGAAAAGPPAFGAGTGDERARLLDKSLSRAGARPDGGRSSLRTEGMQLLVLCPWLTFAAVTAALAFAPPGLGYRMLAWFVVVLGFGFSALMAGVHKNSKVELYKVLAALILLAVITGIPVGRMLYDRIMLPFHVNAGRAPLTGVLASAVTPAAQDASAITFVEGTKLDFRFTLGYRSPEEEPGVAFCVTPVMDVASLEASEALYWAVGSNCCEPSWGFSCGAALSPTARSGIVYRSVPGSERATLRYELFRRAAKQAAAMYRLGIPGEPVLVEWREDAEASVEGSWRRALVYFCIVSLLYLMASLVVAGALHFRSHSKGAARAAMPQYDTMRP